MAQCNTLEYSTVQYSVAYIAHEYCSVHYTTAGRCSRVGGLVWAPSEGRGSTSPLHEFVLLPATGVLALSGGSTWDLATARRGLDGGSREKGEGR